MKLTAAGMIRALLCAALLGLIPACSGEKPSTLGVTDGKFAPCDDSPGCLSTQAQDGERRVEPLLYTGSRDQARGKLVALLRGMPRSSIVSNTDEYVHAAFVSGLFRVIDDVEFSFDDTRKIIHLRSSSRCSWLDLGANRKRVERIRRLFGER